MFDSAVSLAAYGLSALFAATATWASGPSMSTISVAHALTTDFLSWCLILAGIKAYSRYRRDASSDADSQDASLVAEANVLALAISVAVVCEALADIHWVVPFLTPIVYFLLRSADASLLPWSAKNPSTAAAVPGVWDGQMKRLALFVAIAVVSSVALLKPISVVHLLPACVFLGAQAVALITLGQAYSTETPTALLKSIEPVALRVCPIIGLLAIVTFYQSHILVTVPVLSQITLGALTNATTWLLLVLLCRQGHAVSVATLTTFAVSTFDIWDEQTVTRFGTMALVAVGAVAQTAWLLPQGLARKSVYLLAILPLLALLRPSHETIKASLAGKLPAMTGSNLLPDAYTVHSSLHPIEQLSRDANLRFAKMVERQSKTVDEAVAEYRRRYHRAPPPHFDTWFQMAQANGVVLVDEFDTMMKSMEPFWGLSPARIRRDIKALSQTGALWVVKFRGGKIDYTDNGWMMAQIRTWMDAYMPYLPDMDLVFNSLDEPRILVPYANIDAALHGKVEDEQPVDREKQVVQPFKFLDLGHQAWWDLSTTACPVDSPSRQGVFHGRDDERLGPRGTIKFVSNVTLATDVCHNSDYATRHSFFTSPASLVFTDRMVPIFSQAKPSNWFDLLYPSPYYPDRMGEYDPVADVDWTAKNNVLYWAGSSTGGAISRDNWRQQHRMRFVDLVSVDPQRQAQYLQQEVGEWREFNGTISLISKNVDVKLTGAVQCMEDDNCEDLKKHVGIKPGEPVSRSYESKLVMDVDGNSFSGRFWRLLRSKSAILKQAMFKEWHDDWVIPWVHYVPVSIGMSELPETVRWLLQTEDGDRRARAIAEQGSAWSQRALRKKDVEMVWFRMLLEYGRLVSDDRAKMNCCD